jgi:hypothetical protein
MDYLKINKFNFIFFRQEFRKTAANIDTILDREDLLSSVHSEISDYRCLKDWTVVSNSVVLHSEISFNRYQVSVLLDICP